jgi:hypothetical protein
MEKQEAIEKRNGLLNKMLMNLACYMKEKLEAETKLVKRRKLIDDAFKYMPKSRDEEKQVIAVERAWEESVVVWFKAKADNEEKMKKPFDRTMYSILIRTHGNL